MLKAFPLGETGDSTVTLLYVWITVVRLNQLLKETATGCDDVFSSSTLFYDCRSRNWSVSILPEFPTVLRQCRAVRARATFRTLGCSKRKVNPEAALTVTFPSYPRHPRSATGTTKSDGV